MSLPVLAGLALLGGLGAVLRLALDAAVSARVGGRFPLGTLTVNLSGTLALGVLTGAALGGTTLRLAGTGLIGGYTTFSTWMYESQRLAEDGAGAAAGANLAVSLTGGVLLAWAGIRVGRWL